MPYKHIQKTGKYPGRQYLVYTPSIPGELTEALLAKFNKQAKSYKEHAAQLDDFTKAFAVYLAAEGFEGQPWINVSDDKVSVAQDDGKGSTKKNLIPTADLDLRKASAVLKIKAEVA